MLKKTFLLLSALFLFNFFAIFVYSCKCKADYTRNCNIIYGISLEAINNGGLDEKPVIDNTVYAKALLFRLNVDEGIETCFNQIPQWLSNTAFAMTCKNMEKEEFLVEKTLGIYADHDFDALHPAGADLKDLFTVKGSAFYLSKAPEDTSSRYIFTFKKGYLNTTLRTDTFFIASSAPLKLLK